MVFVFDLFQRVTQCLEKILVRGHDRAVHLELNHRLRFADRSDLSVQFNLCGFDANCLRDDFPSRHRPRILLVFVVDRGNQQVQDFRPHFDPRKMRQVLVVGQQAALMGRVLVEDVNRLPNHFRNLHRQELLQRAKVLGGRRVHVLNLQVQPRQDHVDWKVVHHGLHLG